MFVTMAYALGVPSAYARSYVYERIDTIYTINADSTVSVQEVQTFDFTGEYHLGYRSLSLAKTDAITDVSIIDGDTQQPLQYSTQRLDKTDPKNWGRYTVFSENGSKNIEWYYSAADTTHSWIIRYTLHGAISFYKDHDELYWNAFTGLGAPVKALEVTVVAPAAITMPQATFYSKGEHRVVSDRQGGAIYHFTAYDFAANEPATFAVGWQKGLVSKSAYWRDWFRINGLTLLSIIVFAASIIFAFLHWYFIEHRPNRARAIVPQYAPPKELPPAMADLLIHERLTRRSWSATVVDLSTRGYLTITEEKSSRLSFGKDYLISRADTTDLTKLRAYELKFLQTIAPPSGKPFSTRELRRNHQKAQKVYDSMQRIEQLIEKEIQDVTHAYEKTLAAERRNGVLLLLIFVPYFLGIAFIVEMADVSLSLMISLFLLIAAAAMVIHRLFIDARLNASGRVLRTDWLGFKMYLETAERYRLQNLTPDTFEKYLPYAMVFGVEKKWARAFESISMPPPRWYSGSAAGFVAGTSSGGGFSPSGFVSGFSASFSSTFASSGGGGASGGGGGAGGGGGGGGGGAG